MSPSMLCVKPATVSCDRLQYAVSAVGFMIGASADVYSVQLSDCGLDHRNIASLVEPVHAVSDNNVQVRGCSVFIKTITFSLLFFHFFA